MIREPLFGDIGYICALVVYHGDFSSIGMALRVFDCAEDIIISFFLEEESAFFMFSYDFAEFFDDESIFGCEFGIFSGIQMFESIMYDGICGSCSQEAVEDRACGFNSFDAYKGVFSQNVLDVIVEHEVGIDEYASHLIEVKVPKEVGFMGPGGEGVKNALYIWELGVRISFKECSNICIIEEGIFPAFHMALKLFCDVVREGCLACLYAMFRDCGRPSALSCASACSSATFIGCLSHLPISIKYFLQVE